MHKNHTKLNLLLLVDLAGTSATGLINIDNAPTWTTSSGNIGSVEEGATANLSVSASDPDVDTISYSVQSGSLQMVYP